MSRFARLFLAAFAFVAAPAFASAADVMCIAVDQTHDTLTPSDRTAAVLLLTRQFELLGQRVIESCDTPLVVSHIALGRTIVVTLDGPGGRREGTALGLEDLPALYNQMARSIVTGRPMDGFNVVDRTNVTAAQARVERVPTDSFWYARLGYGSVFGDRAYGTPAIGMGYRVEMDAFGVDISFLNYQIGTNGSYYNSDSAFAGSLLKLQGLYFLSPTANRSPYLGAGLSWGGANFGDGFDGSGLQGELSAGYELPRASTLRAFIQADAILPFYHVTAVRYPIDYYYQRNATVSTAQRYAPSFVVSLGLGWQKSRHRR
jgi:hypothetical protein